MIMRFNRLNLFVEFLSLEMFGNYFDLDIDVLIGPSLGDFASREIAGTIERGSDGERAVDWAAEIL